MGSRVSTIGKYLRAEFATTKENCSSDPQAENDNSGRILGECE